VNGEGVSRLAAEIREFEGVVRKRPIGKVVRRLLGEEVDPLVGEVVAAEGEDAAVIRDGDRLLLLAADGIWGVLMERDPWWAGYCSVLVNVNDVLAMGGLPVAVVNVLASSDPEVCDEVIEGMREGARKFSTPVVGGHTHPDAPHDSVDAAVLGATDEEHLVLSSTAEPGDLLVFVVDLDGRQYPGFPLNWDTTTMKDPSEIRRQMEAVREASAHVKAGKDVSNPGLIGTLAMMLEVSGRLGAEVILDEVPKPEGLDWATWLKSYPGVGFIYAVEDEDSADRVIGTVERAGLVGAVVGRVNDTGKVEISMGGRSATVFDLKKEGILSPRGGAKG